MAEAMRVELVSPRDEHLAWVDVPADFGALPHAVEWDGAYFHCVPVAPWRVVYRACTVYHVQGDELS
jgi:hypothetical protein